ncbi:hypothetical protein OE88DRAFT_485085 [Heliocybe sulcata]|uniref:MYND-type domain-containing protein n=1 Tax=Heliocybe sulcata TaxID=5364 RepID=A0A5C3MWU8_9AGAM|nr:hypothetical protein OE88DRAFT_485085 [Heliocybe sulcata]
MDVMLGSSFFLQDALTDDVWLDDCPDVSEPSALASLLRRELQPVWFKTLAHLQTRATHVPEKPNAADIVCAAWLRLGQQCGFRHDDSKWGCSWYRCPLYGERTERRMRHCQCDLVQYCNKDCQTADWREGGHRDICPRRRAPYVS